MLENSLKKDLNIKGILGEIWGESWGKKTVGIIVMVMV